MRYKIRKEWSSNFKETLATIPSRLFAMMIDLIIVGLIMIMTSIVFFWFGPEIDIHGDNFIQDLIKMKLHFVIKSNNLNEHEINLIKIIFGFIPTIYFSLMTYFTNGQSIGKKIFGIKIVSVYHDRLNIWHCMERSLGYIASCLELGLGFLQIFWNPNRMTLHDKIGETVVIKIRKKNN
jgi:uncharacterized RDD family membrane protein YckC